MVNKNKLRKIYREVAKLQKTRGYATYDDLNGLLADDQFSDEELEELMVMLQNIQLVENEKEHILLSKTPSRIIENPFSVAQRKLLLKWSRLAAQRRQTQK